MPLAIPQQVLSQPVTNYYKGKAMRQELAMSEKKEELLDLNIEAAKNPPVDPKEQRDAENHMKDSLAESFAVAEMIRQKGGNESEWTEAFNNSLSTSTNPEVLAEAVRLYDKNGDGILGSDELDLGVAFAISRGQELQEESGEDSPYAKINPKDFTPESVAEFERTGSYSSLQRADTGSDSPDNRAQRIAAAEGLLTEAGVPNAASEAIKVADKLIRYTPDPSGGSLYRTDMITGTTTEVNIERPERGEMPQLAYEDTLHGLADTVAGIGPAITTAIAKGTAPAEIEALQARATAKARQRFKAAENTLIRAFSLNPKYPVAEQNRIKDNIDVQPKTWDNAAQMRSRMEGVREFLEFEKELAIYETKRPGIDKADRSNYEQAIGDIDRFLAVLGKPPSTEEMGAVEKRLAEIDARLAELNKD